MLARLLAGAVVVAGIAVGAPAGAGAAEPPQTETASLGSVSATFTYRDAGDGKWEDLKLKVTRDGQAAFDAVPAADGCGGPYCAPAGRAGAPALKVADLDGDGEPEVLVDLYTGGAHCCVVAEILRWNGTAYVTTTRDFADIGYRLKPATAAGAPATFATGDPRFAYAFAAFAFSAFPVRLLTYGAGGWRDVTRAHPETLKADAERWLKTYRKHGSGHPLGHLAAWAADEYRLGPPARRAADRFLQHELRAGHLRGDKGWPRGRAYVTTLKRRLRVWGYGR
jgi:hypothetical protein